MVEFSPNIDALIASGTPILNDYGLSLEFCTEIEVDTVEGLSRQQKNALKMAVRKRAQSQQVQTLIAATRVRFDAFENMISPIVQNVKSKVGSELGKLEVECFNKISLPAACLPEYVLPTHQSPEEYQFVHRMVLEYTHEMIDIAKQKNVNEVNEETHIHPPTFKLLQDLVKHFLPAPEMEFFEKSLIRTVEIGYETCLRTHEGVLPVTGETDLLICIGGVPVGNVEVKNLSMPCNTPNEIGEILAQDKGFAERHKRRVGVEPRVFPSVLVSGQRWVFVDRSFKAGNEQYLLFPALVTFKRETVGEGAVYKVDEANVEMVSRMLMRMMHAMGKLIKAIGTTRKRMYDVYAERKDTEGGGGERRGRGRGRGGGKKRAILSNLSMENMYRHDLDTPRHRVVHL